MTAPRQDESRPAASAMPAMSALTARGATLGLLLTVLFWAGNFTATKIALTEIPPLPYTGVRFFLGTAVLAAFLYYREGTLRPPPGTLVPLIVLGVVGNTIYQLLFVSGLALTTATNSSLILAKLLADNREGTLTPEQVKYARGITSAGNDLLALINDILDLSKIEARKIEITRNTVSIADLVRRLSETFEPLAEQKQVFFRVIRGNDLPATIETDAQRLSQILRNLLSNALKFTERGEVALEVTSRGEHIEFAVRDTGIGIAEEHHQIIFEPFRQADGTTNRKFGGTGLGLSISRELARLLGGQISVESRTGEGSTFRLLMPRVAPAVKQDGAAPAHAPVAPMAPHPTPEARASVRAVTAATQRAVPDDRGAIRKEGRVLLVIEDDPVFAKLLYDLAH